MLINAVTITKEDDVVVARCLDFSVSSHGENEEEALNSLSDSIKDYLNYAVEYGALDEIIDPDENELSDIKENADILKSKKIKEITYA